jgi:hypothetical protein
MRKRVSLLHLAFKFVVDGPQLTVVSSTCCCHCLFKSTFDPSNEFIPLLMPDIRQKSMAKIDFTSKEVAALRSHYLKERNRLSDELAHVGLMLEKLGGAPDSSIQGKVKSHGLTAKGLPPKKRGPKSVWGSFIQKRLRARNRPMSYEELIEDAMAIHKIPENRREAAKASILNSAFRLRTVHGKIVTVGRVGKKDKMVVLTKWLEENGALKPEYAQAFKEVMGGKPQRVDMTSVPESPYPEGE